MSCAICLEDNSELIHFRPCNHKCVCTSCIYPFFVKLFREPEIACPICRAEVKWIYDHKLQQEALIDSKTNLALYRSLKIALNSNNVTTKEMYKIYQEFYKMGPVILLNVHQVTKLLGRLVDTPDKYKYEKILVAMCFAPWKVDRALTGVGLCYHGNFGEVPACLIAQINYMKYNIRFLLKQGVYA